MKHAIQEGHHFDFENSTILANESNKSKRLIKEMMEMKNFKSDIEKLKNVGNVLR